MEAGFWHQKWKSNQLGFHNAEVNPLLVKHFNALALAENSRVFVPLCGKTLDIHWLLLQGFRIVGSELSELAVTQLFDELGIAPTVKPMGQLNHYSAENIDIFVGDIFALTSLQLGPVDAIYDRAALVALPQQVRGNYSQQLITLAPSAQQLVICYHYDQSLISGPPFSISDQELASHYQGHYTLTLLDKVSVEGGFKGKYPAIETVWRLSPIV